MSGEEYVDPQGDFEVPVGSSYYEPSGTVDVEPADLKDFADFLGDDVQAFRDVRTNAVNGFFEEAIPPFAGDMNAANGMPEGLGFQQEYFNREMAMQMFMNDVEMGLTALSMAALFIHADYVASDFISGGTGDGGFADYSESAVTRTLDGSGVPNVNIDEMPGEHGGESEIQQEWSDEVALAEEQADLGATEYSDGGEDMFGEGDLGYTGDTLHEGQAGEYAIENDTTVSGQELSRGLDFNEDGEAIYPNYGPNGLPEWQPDLEENQS